MTIKMQSPTDILSRMYILDYLRELGAEHVYKNCNTEQQKLFFYKFTGEEDETMIDYNWEYCIFVATMSQLEYLMQPFISEIEEIEEKRLQSFRKIQKEASNPNEASVSIYDLAKANMEQIKQEGLTDEKGFKL